MPYDQSHNLFDPTFLDNEETEDAEDRAEYDDGLVVRTIDDLLDAD